MKKRPLLLGLLIICLHAYAQDPAHEKIKQELAGHPQQDSFRVNRLNQLSFYGKDEKTCQEALSISQKIGYSIGEGYALANLGFLKGTTNSRNEADALFRRAASIAKKTGNLDLSATIQVNQGFTTVFFDPKLALVRLLTAEKSAEKTGNKKLLSICQFFIAIQYANALSNISKGMEYYLKSIHTAEQVNYLRFLCNAYIAVGRLYNRMDDDANAALYFGKAKQLNKQWKNPTIESQLLMNEGQGYQKAGRYPDAIAVFKKALGLVRSVDSGIIVALQSRLGDAYTGIDSFSLAFKYEFNSMAYAKRRGDRLLLAEVVVSLANTYLKNKMPDSAIYYSRLGYDSAKDIGAMAVMRDNAEILANAYAYKKDFAHAYTYYLLYTNYRDSVLNTSVRDRSALVQYNFDLEKKQFFLSHFICLALLSGFYKKFERSIFFFQEQFRKVSVGKSCSNYTTVVENV